jgi:MFS family permease
MSIAEHGNVTLRVPRVAAPDPGGRTAKQDNAIRTSAKSGLAARWPVIGILSLMAVESAISAFTYPYFSLALEKYGLSNWAIGLNASLAGAGILFVGPFLPRMIAVLGLPRLSAGMFGLPLLCFAAMLLVDHVAIWFASRFIMGACFAALWAATEIWLNGVVSDRQRGRVMSLAMIFYTVAQFVGPLAVSLTGVSGILPFVVVMAPLAVALFVALTIRTSGAVAEQPGTTGREAMHAALTLARPVIIIAFLIGIATTSAQSLLPLFGLMHGLTDQGASDLVVVFGLGEALFVGLFGILADRYDRRRLLRLCAIPTALIAAGLPFATDDMALLSPVLFLVGGMLGGVYTLGLILIGQDFRGHTLAVVSTGFAMAYSAGAVVGSTPVGYLIDVFGPGALPVAIAATLAVLAVVVLRRHQTAVQREPAGTVVQDNLAASVLDQSEAIDIEETEVGDFQVGDDRQSKERDLEKWFIQRASETARRAAERDKARADRLERTEAHQAGERKGKVRKHFAA